jgi:hypothetical protein
MRLPNLDQENVAKGLFDELVVVLTKYNNTLLTPTVIGVLEMVKADLIYATAVQDDQEGDDE